MAAYEQRRGGRAGWTTLGSTAGALLLYLLGATLGLDRLRRVADRVPLLSAGDVDRAVTAFARRGGTYVFFGRMVPAASGIVLLLAVVAIVGLVLRRVRALRTDEAQAPPVDSRRPPV